MERINFQNNVTKANEETMNQLQDNIENAINEVNNKFDVLNNIPILSSYINNENTNINIKEINNLLILSGVIYFTSKPGIWTKFIELPNNYKASGYGNLVEESTGLTKPVIIQNGNEIVMSADLSQVPIYTYINITFTKE